MKISNKLSKKITIITGHYGAGKTNFAVNLALYFKESGKKVAIADLDIVNPYFRTADFKKLFNDTGIELAASDFANSSLDIPSVKLDVTGLADKTDHLIIDVGGDPEGARALGRFVPTLKKSGYDMVYVINRYRNLTQSAGQAVEIMKNIESSCKLKCTALFNNSHLGKETTDEVISQSNPFADEVSRLTGLPLLELPVEVYVKPIWDM